MTVFNHSGIQRTVADGEHQIPEAEITVKIYFKNHRIPELYEGGGILNKTDNNGYTLTVPAGDWAFIKF